MEKVLGQKNAYILILTFELFFLLTNQVQIWQKPHEHFSFLVSFACAIYLINIFLNNIEKDKFRIVLSSILLGFSFGVYTPPVILIALIVFAFALINFRILNFRTLAFSYILFGLIALPQIFVMLKTYLRFRTTPTPMIYQITEFFPSLWVPIWLILILFISYKFPVRSEFGITQNFLKTFLIFLSLIYLGVQIAYFFNQIINRSDIVLISLLVCMLWLSILQLPLKFVDDKFFEITSLLVISISFFANTTPLYPGADTDFRSNNDISVARAGNPELQKVSQIYESGFCGFKVFANDELRFLPASTRCRMPMTLPFNEGNTGPDIPYQSRVQQLTEALSELDSKKMNQWLDESDTNFLAFVSIDNKFSFEFLVNKGYPVSWTILTPTISIKVDDFINLLDDNWTVRLQTSNLLVAYKE
jgi:hypothetical protein